MIFLSPFPYVTWMSMSTATKLLNFLPEERFPLTYDLNSLKSRAKRHVLISGFFLLSTVWNET